MKYKNRVMTYINDRKEKIMTKMTQREFLMEVKKANISDAINEKADELIAGLDKRNAQKSATQTKTQKENEVLKAEMLKKLEKGKGYLAVEIASVMGFSTSKASALAKQLVDGGKATVADVKVKGKGMQKCYTLTLATDEVAE